MLGHRHACVDRIGHPLVVAHLARPIEDLDAVLGLADFDLTSNERPGNRVAVASHVDVALRVHGAVVQLIDVGHVQRQRP